MRPTSMLSNSGCVRKQVFPCDVNVILSVFTHSFYHVNCKSSHIIKLKKQDRDNLRKKCPQTCLNTTEEQLSV